MGYGQITMKAVQPGVVALPFKFATDSDGDVTTATATGTGYSVARSSRGKYRITLDRKYVNLDGLEAHCDSKFKVERGADSVNASTAYVDLYVYDSSGVIALGAFDAADDDLVVTAVAGTAANALTVAAQPDLPRTLTATFAAGWDGGDITIVGTDMFGDALTETLTANPGGTTSSAKAFASVTSVTKGAVGVAADTVKVGITNEVGTMCDVVAGKLMVQDDSAGGGGTVTGTFDATNDTVVLATDVPDGTTNYFIVGEHRTLRSVVSGNVFGVLYLNESATRSAP